MRSITIDGSQTVTVGGVVYYYADITVSAGNYIVVPGRDVHISISTGGNVWSICSGRSYKVIGDEETRLVVAKSYVNPNNVTPFTYAIEYDITSLRVVQLEDVDAYPVTPYTSGKSVVLDNGKDVETQIGYMDPAVISAEEVNAFVTIARSGDTAVEDVMEAGSEYREDIDELTAHIEELDRQVFPLTITYTLTPNFNSYENTIAVTLKEYDTGEPNLNKEYVEKWSNDEYMGKVYNPAEYHSAFSFVTPIQGMKEKFTIVAETVNNKSASTSTTRYLCFYGATSASEMTSEIAMSLRKTLTTSVSFNPTISTKYGEYIWLIVPSYLDINKVKSGGFDVTLDEPEMVVIGGFGTYKCYRSLNALDKADWKLTIS